MGITGPYMNPFAKDHISTPAAGRNYYQRAELPRIQKTVPRQMMEYCLNHRMKYTRVLEEDP